MPSLPNAQRLILDGFELYAHSVVMEASNDIDIIHASEQMQILCEKGCLQLGTSGRLWNRFLLVNLVNNVCTRKTVADEAEALIHLGPQDWQIMLQQLQECRSSIMKSNAASYPPEGFDKEDDDMAKLSIFQELYQETHDLIRCHLVIAQFRQSLKTTSSHDDIPAIIHDYRQQLPAVFRETLLPLLSSPSSLSHTTNNNTTNNTTNNNTTNNNNKNHNHTVETILRDVLEELQSTHKSHSYHIVQEKVKTLARTWNDQLFPVPILARIGYGGGVLLLRATGEDLTGRIVDDIDNKTVSDYGMHEQHDEEPEAAVMAHKDLLRLRRDVATDVAIAVAAAHSATVATPATVATTNTASNTATATANANATATANANAPSNTTTAGKGPEEYHTADEIDDDDERDTDEYNIKKINPKVRQLKGQEREVLPLEIRPRDSWKSDFALDEIRDEDGAFSVVTDHNHNDNKQEADVVHDDLGDVDAVDVDAVNHAVNHGNHAVNHGNNDTDLSKENLVTVVSSGGLKQIWNTTTDNTDDEAGNDDEEDERDYLKTSDERKAERRQRQERRKAAEKMQQHHQHQHHPRFLETDDDDNSDDNHYLAANYHHHHHCQQNPAPNQAPVVKQPIVDDDESDDDDCVVVVDVDDCVIDDVVDITSGATTTRKPQSVVQRGNNNNNNNNRDGKRRRATVPKSSSSSRRRRRRMRCINYSSSDDDADLPPFLTTTIQPPSKVPITYGEYMQKKKDAVALAAAAAAAVTIMTRRVSEEKKTAPKRKAMRTTRATRTTITTTTTMDSKSKSTNNNAKQDPKRQRRYGSRDK